MRKTTCARTLPLAEILGIRGWKEMKETGGRFDTVSHMSMCVNHPILYLNYVPD